MFLDNPAQVSAQSRLHEVAAILALGILRLRSRTALSENLPNLPLTCLDSTAETSLTVRVVNGTDTDERNET